MPFDRTSTSSKVIEIIAEQLGVKKDAIHEDDTLESLGADSLDRVEIVMKLEEEFGIEINDTDADKLTTVNQVIDYVTSLRKK